MRRVQIIALIALFSTGAHAELRRDGHGYNRLERLGLEAIHARPEQAAMRPVERVDDEMPRLAEHRAAKKTRERITKLLRKKGMGGVKMGLVVVDTKSGEEWVQIGADDTLNPASTLKLFTAAIALDRLGPKHRFKTQLLRYKDRLYLQGDGDPALDVHALKKMVARIARKRFDINGIFVDPHAFAGGVLPPGYNAKKSHACYRSAVGAVALNFGCAQIAVRAGKEGKRPRVTIEPIAAMTVDNRARSVSGRGTTLHLSTHRGDNLSTRLLIRGRLGRKRRGAHVARRRIHHPPISAGQTLRALLTKKRFVVTGGVKMGRTPKDAQVLVTHRSPPLGELIASMNKHSNNFIAEMLFRGLVKPASGAATWKEAQRIARQWLRQRLGFKAGQFRLNNGSGLYAGGLFSARQVTTLLRIMNKHPHRLSYRNSLAIAGRDGTLIGRLRGTNYAGKMVGKTGTLDHVSALSGYVRTRRGRRLAFSILMNQTGGATVAMRKIQDQIVAILIEAR